MAKPITTALAVGRISAIPFFFFLLWDIPNTKDPGASSKWPLHFFMMTVQFYQAVCHVGSAQFPNMFATFEMLVLKFRWWLCGCTWLCAPIHLFLCVQLSLPAWWMLQSFPPVSWWCWSDLLLELSTHWKRPCTHWFSGSNWCDIDVCSMIHGRNSTTFRRTSSLTRERKWSRNELQTATTSQIHSHGQTQPAAAIAQTKKSWWLSSAKNDLFG